MMKGLFITLGTLFVGLGILGVFLPLLPTTPFLLVAAACYAKGSERFYQRLISNQWLSPYILAYRSNEGLPVKLKIRILLLLWSSILLTVTLALTSTLAKLFLISIAVLVSTSILRLPTKR